MNATDGPLNRPLPIVFAVSRGIQQLTDGSLNILSVYDRLNVMQMPDGTRAETVTLQVACCWTGGNGAFTQVLRFLDADGHQIAEQQTDFTLPDVVHRHWVIALVTIPSTDGVYTIAVGRSDQELLRQSFTIGTMIAPGTAP